MMIKCGAADFSDSSINIEEEEEHIFIHDMKCQGRRLFMSMYRWVIRQWPPGGWTCCFWWKKKIELIELENSK
jgi:hypothetical protein